MMENRYTKTTPKGWNLKTVEQVFDFYPTASYSRDKMFKDNNPSAIGYIHYGDIHTKYNLILDVPNTEIPYISEELKKDFEYINPNRSLGPISSCDVKVFSCSPESKECLPLIHGSHKT